MSSTDKTLRFAVCKNVANCAIARAGDAIEWYGGAGEYCPDCGEALTLRDPLAEPPSQPAAPAVHLLPATEPRAPPTDADIRRPMPTMGLRGRLPRTTPLHWLWILSGALVASAVVAYSVHRGVSAERTSSNTIAICTVRHAQKLASESQFGDSGAIGCDVRFSTAAETPDVVTAYDRRSATSLRGIFNGLIRGWSELDGRSTALQSASRRNAAKSVGLIQNPAADPNPRVKGATIEGRLNPCTIRPMTDATRSACTPFHVRDVLKERDRLYERCEQRYSSVTPKLSSVLRTYCEDWSSRQTSVALDGMVKSRDADPLTTGSVSFKRL